MKKLTDLQQYNLQPMSETELQTTDGGGLLWEVGKRLLKEAIREIGEHLSPRPIV